jgi:dihydroneopterin aldolase
MATLTTTSRTRALAPDPPATVRVQNLHTTLQHAGHDAWNRAHKAQPCLLSAEVSFVAPFGAASAHDRLGEDTVHYGTLSKAVLASVAAFEVEAKGDDGGQERGLRSVLARVWRDLTGLGLDGSVSGEGRKKAFLDVTRVRFLAVTVALPKASLLGEGVGLTASAVFGQEGRMEARALALEVSRLRVPTLIGVNANERLAKQFVIATVTVDGFEREEDVYTEVEGVVVKVAHCPLLIVC